MIPLGTLICSYKLYDYCKNRYKNHNVVADVNVDYDDFYYFNRKSKRIRLVRNKSIYAFGDKYIYVRIR